MKLNLQAVFIAVVFVSASCNGIDGNNSSINENTENDSNNSNLPDTSWLTIDSQELFTVSIPPEMETLELNDEASLEYGYYEKTDNEARELYMVVLVETKAEIDSFNLDFDFDAMSYRDISIESLGESLKDYEILTKDPEVETINGMNCVINETRGDMTVVSTEDPDGMEEIGVYYVLGVYEGKKAFYQVLSWCLEDQKELFESDMMRIVKSFKEKE